MDVWKTKQAEQIKEKHRVEQALKELEARKDKIFDLMIKDAIDGETYKEKTSEVSNEIMVKKIELNEVGIELGDIETCLNYCKFIMGNIADLWLNADLNLKQRFQTLVFPDKIYFEGETFRTTATASIFKQLQQKSLSEYCLASPSGFEPESSE